MPANAHAERGRRRRRATGGMACLCFWAVLLSVASSAAAQIVHVPIPTFEAFHPKGLRVSIPDADGLEIFAFHGNVNKPLRNVDAGEMSVDVTSKSEDGRWVYENEDRRLKVGDVINYWVFLQVDRKGYQRLGLSHEITELTSRGGEPTAVHRPALGLEALPALPASLQGEQQSGQLGGQRASGFGFRPPQQASMALALESLETLESRPFQEQYRPRPQRPSDSRPSNPFDSRPSSGGSWSPAGESQEYRPPPGEHRPPPGEHRPPPGEHRPPPEEYRPEHVAYRPPPGDHRPPPGEYRPPPGEYRPPPGEHRPPPGEHRPPPGDYRPPNSHYGARPPPPPTYNHEYPPPPPATVVHHNHHVGFATGEDSHGHNNNNNGGGVYPVGFANGEDSHGHNNNNFNNNNNGGSVYPVGFANGEDTHGQNNNNFNNNNGGSVYPVDNKPTYPVNPPTHQGLSNPDDYEPTLAAVRPTTTGSTGWQAPGSVPDQGPDPVVPVLPLTPGDRVTVRPPPGPPPGPPRPPGRPTCELSATHVNGRPACKGELVFEENWNTLDLQKWSHEVKISGSPDYEFCIYAQHPENTFVKKGWLHLKSTLTNDKYGDDFVRKGNLQLEGCTAGPLNSESCSREAMFSYILPPVVASRLTTKKSFSFKYGRIDVRARLPRGDWIYPEVWLQPLHEEYGPGLASGRIHLAMARGNRKLQASAPGRQDISGSELAVGVLAGGDESGSAGARRKFFTKHNDVGHWGADFHNYTLLWTPETLAFSVDGVELGVARPEEYGGLLRGQSGDGEDPWARGSKIAPFDKEFYISLGMAVGGIHAFPDGCRSGNHEKPWKNTAAKAMLSFWNAREVWHSTWNGQQSELLVESVRVTALNN